MKARLGPVWAIVAVSVAASTLPAQARSIFCCKDERGVDACSDVLPPVCQGRAYREIDARGMTIRRVDAPLSAEQRARKEAQTQEARKEEQKRLEQKRRDRALLATYSSEKDIDYMRDRAVADLEKAVKAAQEKHEEAARKQKKLAAEAYKNKDMPPGVKAAMRDNEADMKAQQSAIAEKKKEIEEVRAKYDNERLRYRELTADGKPAASSAGDAPARPR